MYSVVYSKFSVTHFSSLKSRRCISIYFILIHSLRRTTTATDEVESTNKRLKYGDKTCLPQHVLNSNIFQEMNEADKMRNPPLCMKDEKDGDQPCTFETRTPDQWSLEAEKIFMEILLKRNDVCDINLLLNCNIFITEQGSHGYECKCRDYSAKLEGKQEMEGELKKCVAAVGYPCEFRNPFGHDIDADLDLQLTASGYSCTSNAECRNLGDKSEDQNGSIQDRISHTVGYPANIAEWPPPMVAYILKRIAKVCVCSKGYAADGDGQCIPVDPALRGKSIASTRNLQNYMSRSLPSVVLLSFLRFNVAIF